MLKIGYEQIGEASYKENYNHKHEVECLHGL